MPIERTYACPDCGGQFRFLHMTRQELPPDNCDLCGSDMTGEEPQLPRVNIGGSAIVKSVDQVYKHHEASTGHTDMKDGLREGDAAAVTRMPNNDVTRFAASSGHNFWQGNVGGMSTEQLKADARPGAKIQRGVLEKMQSRHLGIG